MALGITGEVQRLLDATRPTSRYTNLAIRLEVCDRGDDGDPKPVGCSRVFGGVWDSWTDAYADLDPVDIQNRQVTAAQFEYCVSDKARITGAGGRGGGKSEALAQRCECLLLDRPGEHGLVVSPDYAHTQIVWHKLLNRIHPWCLPGTAGIHRTEHLLRLTTGSTVRFLSADNPDSLRGWDAHWLAVDEEKDVSDEAIDIAMLCLRLSDRPLIFGAGTPEVGEYSERYAKLEDSDDCAVFKFPSRDNVFIPHAVFDLAVSLMDEKRYRQEVLAEFVRMDEDAVVAKGFDRRKHMVNVDELELKDVTRAYTKHKVGRSYDFVAGVDYNHDSPCVAWIYRVFTPNVWVVVDVIKARDPAHYLAQAIKDAGYAPHRVLVIDDASGEWQDAQGRRSPNSSRRGMRSLGFTCINPDPNVRKNPPVRARVDAFLAKLSPMSGEATWFYDTRMRDVVVPVMENQLWHSSGNILDKEAGHDHDMDACTYPIHRLEPPFRKKRNWG